MTNERAKELLNAVINYALVNNNVFDVIEELIEIGFTKEELVLEFNFSEDDVEDC